jgi:hypothetical protein
MASGDNWTKEETQEHCRKQAIKNLEKVKKQRKGKKYKMVQIDSKTWKEIEIKDEDN